MCICVLPASAYLLTVLPPEGTGGPRAAVARRLIRFRFQHRARNGDSFFFFSPEKNIAPVSDCRRCLRALSHARPCARPSFFPSPPPPPPPPPPVALFFLFSRQSLDHTGVSHSDAWKWPKGMRQPWSMLHPIGVYRNCPSNNIFIASGWLNATLGNHPRDPTIASTPPAPLSTPLAPILPPLLQPALVRSRSSPFRSPPPPAHPAMRSPSARKSTVE